MGPSAEERSREMQALRALLTPEGGLRQVSVWVWVCVGGGEGGSQ
jgi:hypothetical protein